MSIEASVYGALLPLVGGRVFPDIAPEGTQKPFITWQQIGGNVINPLSNDAPGKRNAFMQVNVWATSRLAAVNLSLSVEDALRGIGARPQAAVVSIYEPDTALYGTIQEFSIWSDR